ncbi:hypothetical protein DVH05_027133 [Phytophthora capsici]|nr:hypothetical protein DVH05_027133 [Phytophthora capsici]
MDILDCAHLKLKLCSLIWRHVQLQLSYEYHWTKHNEVAVLSITRNRRRSLFSKVDCILLDQILLDSSTYLLPPSSRDLHRLRFCLQNGEKTFKFQAPDEVTYEMWRVAIVDAISMTAEIEQRFQTASFIDIDVKKAEKDGNVMMEA